MLPEGEGEGEGVSKGSLIAGAASKGSLITDGCTACVSKGSVIGGGAAGVAAGSTVGLAIKVVHTSYCRSPLTLVG